MVDRIKDKPVLVIAGPGAGKTYDMVAKVVEVLPCLRPNRFLAVITYTNAAAESIRERLCTVAEIAPNVFVGTIHSFLNQFILKPYATLFGHVSQDKMFLEIDVGGIVKRRLRQQRGSKSNGDHALRNVVRGGVIRKLLADGKVPFEQIPVIAATLVENQRVRDVICSRIQYLFIDEFQDIDTCQMKVFEAIRKGRKTTVYAVGDPEQYIMGFTYKGMARRRPNFDNIPMNKFAADRRTNVWNRRSHSEIVDFTNHFHTRIQQKALKGGSKHAGVFFIADTEMDAIISRYRQLTQILDADGESALRFYLGYENQTFDGYVDKYGLTPVSNDTARSGSLMDEALTLISAAAGMTSSQMLEKHELDQLGARKLAMRLIKLVRDDNPTPDEVVCFVRGCLGLNEDSEFVRVDSQLRRLANRVCSDAVGARGSHQHSSIHKAKGLEADAVLVVASSEAKLKKWLETEKSERCNDKNDACRVGFVAFSRAKQMLCIACKEPISDELREKMRTLGVRID